MAPPFSAGWTSLAQPLPLQPHLIDRRILNGMTASISIFIYLLLVVGSTAAILLVSHRVGRRPLTAEKDVPYECGMPPIEKEHTQFPVRFYKVALLFVIFDVEIVFLYLWAVVVRDLGVFGLGEMFVFIAVLLAALVYVWRKGDLQWE
jgi:NADH-quinone oxidoreductase subunit A